VIAEPAPPPFPDPKKFARASSRPVSWSAGVPRAHRQVRRRGPAFGVRLGYDVFRWLAVQVHVSGASSDANLPRQRSANRSRPTCTSAKCALDPDPPFGLFLEAAPASRRSPTTCSISSVSPSANNHFSFSCSAAPASTTTRSTRHFSFGLDVD